MYLKVCIYLVCDSHVGYVAVTKP